MTEHFYKPKAKLGSLLTLTVFVNLLLAACAGVQAAPQATGLLPSPTPEPTVPQSTAGPTLEPTSPQSTASPTPEPTVPQPTATPTEEMVTPSAEQTINMVGRTFNPKEITVPVGTTVVWENTSSLPHTVTADDGSFNSGTLSPGGAFEVTFTKTGQVPYHCEFHGAAGGVGMSGTITVTSP